MNYIGHIQLVEGISDEVYEYYKLDALETHFSNLNTQVDNGIISISDNLDIIENNLITPFSNNYISSSTHWWGRSTVYNNAQANGAAQMFRDFALGYGTVAGLGAFVPGVGTALAAAGGLSATYSNLVASRIDVNNNGNGVVLDMTWALVFTVNSR